MTDFCEALWLSSQKGANYLLRSQNINGCIGSTILDNYKIPLALISTGHVLEAWSSLIWINHICQTSSGQFHKGDNHKEVLRSSTYRNAFIILAALSIGYYDIYNKDAINNFLTYQDENTGAFYGEHFYDRAALQNTNHSSLAGLFCLCSGNYEKALKVANYVILHFYNQPDISRRFIIHTNTSGVLFTDFPREESFWFEIDFSLTKGHYWAIAMGAYFLSELYIYSKQKEYLDTAINLIQLCYILPDGYQKWPSSGKLALAAANIYRITKDSKYNALACDISEKCFLKSQNNDGSWGSFSFIMGINKGYTLTEYELTAEFTFLTSMISKKLKI